MTVSRVQRLGLVGLAALLVCAAAPPVPLPPWQRQLREPQRSEAQQLYSQFVRSWQSGDFTAAAETAGRLERLRRKEQGADHWQTVQARCDLVTMQRVEKASRENREAFQSILQLRSQADELSRMGSPARAQPLYVKVRAICLEVLGEDDPQTANSSDQLGVNLLVLGRYVEPHRLFEEALAIRSRTLGPDHPTTSRSYNNLAANLQMRGQYAAAQRLLERALAISHQVLGKDDPEMAQGYNNLAGNLAAQGKHAAAQPLFEKALEICRATLGEKHERTAASYNNLAYNLYARGDYPAAQPLYEKALQIKREVQGEEHPATATTWHNLALNLYAQGRYIEAHSAFENALAIRRKMLGEEHPDTATSYNFLAENLAAQGQHAAAGPRLEKALVIRRLVLGEMHPDTGQSYNSVGRNLQAQGRYVAAQGLFEKALEISLTQGVQPRHTATCYSNLASNLHAQGRHADAQRLFETALVIHRKVLGEEHPDTAHSLDNLAFNLNAQRQYAAAQRLFVRAGEIYGKVLGREHPDTVRSYHNLAGNLGAQGRFADAQRLFEQTPLRDAAAHHNLALQLHAQGQYARAEQSWKRAAAAFSHERSRAAAAGLERVTFRSKHSPLICLAAVLARNEQPVEAWQRFEESLAQSTLEELAARLRWSTEEQARLEKLRGGLDRLDRLIQNHIAAPEDSPQRDKERESLLRQRRDATDQLAEFREHLRKRHGVLAAEIPDRAALQKALPADSAFVAWLDLPTVPGAKDPAGDHWAVLLRSTGDPVWTRLSGSGPGGAWTVDDSRLSVLLRQALGSPAGKWQTLADQLRRQRLAPLERHLVGIRHLIVLPSFALDGLPLEVLAGERAVSYVPSAGWFLHLQRQPPPKTTDVLALADPTLQRQPAPAPPHPRHGLLVRLVVPGSSAQRARIQPGDVLLEYAEHKLETVEELSRLLRAPSPVEKIDLTLWRAGKTSVHPIPPGPLGIVFDRLPAPQALRMRLENDRLLAKARGEDEKWSPLPGTRLEAEALRRLLGEKRVTLLTESAASEQKLDELARGGKLRNYRYLHLATHGVVDVRTPLQSALILARDNLPDPLQQLRNDLPVYDGRLSAEEVLRHWKLDSDLVTLSACQTALGKHIGGEGFLGFPQAFLLAGSRSVLVSLWKVDDTATALFMDRCYQNLLGKRVGLETPLSKAEALREARSWLRSLSRAEALGRGAELVKGVERGKGKPIVVEVPAALGGVREEEERPYAHPYYWAAFVLVGRPD